MGSGRVRVVIIVALHQPFETQIDQGRRVDDEFSRFDSGTILHRSGAPDKGEQGQ